MRFTSGYFDSDLPITRRELNEIFQAIQAILAARASSRRLAMLFWLLLVALCSAPVVIARGLGVPWTFAIVMSAVALVLAMVAGHFLSRRRLAPLVRRELRARGFHVCIACGYWLRDLTPGHPCPECGSSDAPSNEPGA